MKRLCALDLCLLFPQTIVALRQSRPGYPLSPGHCGAAVGACNAALPHDRTTNTINNNNNASSRGGKKKQSKPIGETEGRICIFSKPSGDSISKCQPGPLPAIVWKPPPLSRRHKGSSQSANSTLTHQSPCTIKCKVGNGRINNRNDSRALCYECFLRSAFIEVCAWEMRFIVSPWLTALGRWMGCQQRGVQLGSSHGWAALYEWILRPTETDISLSQHANC